MGMASLKLLQNKEVLAEYLCAFLPLSNLFVFLNHDPSRLPVQKRHCGINFKVIYVQQH